MYREVRDIIQLLKVKVEDDSNLVVADLKPSLEKALEVIYKRQKLIRLADSSTYGWATVSEYEAHQLADNEDDDNKITRAENQAACKLKQKRSASATATQQQKRRKWDNGAEVGSFSGNNFRRSRQVYPYRIDQSQGRSLLHMR